VWYILTDALEDLTASIIRAMTEGSHFHRTVPVILLKDSYMCFPINEADPETLSVWQVPVMERVFVGCDVVTLIPVFLFLPAD
jgi:hypothetical protein